MSLGKYIPLKEIVKVCCWWFLLVHTLMAQDANTFSRGEIIDAVACKNFPDQSYALYLPSYYDPIKQWPAIYIFEPAARGSLPLKHMMPAAEQYGYILICSNNSRNGPWELIFKAGEAMVSDSQERFSVDNDRIYTSGFSGGARAAMAIAVISGEIAGVIACGAGFSKDPNHAPQKDARFSYLGLIGNKDMNYNEMGEVRKKLTALDIDNKLIIFNGGHEWPPEHIMKQGFSWLEVEAMRKGLKEKNDHLIDFLFEYQRRSAQALKDSAHHYEAWQTLTDIKNSFNTLKDLNKVEQELTDLENSKDLRKDNKEKEKTKALEEEMLATYLNAFYALSVAKYKITEDYKDERWWKNEVGHLEKLSRHNDLDKQLMGKRMIDFLWRRCVESGQKFITEEDYKTAIKIYRLWTIIQPQSKYAYYNLAKAHALNSDIQASLDNIKLAVKNGMSNKKLIEENPAFDLVRKNKRYQKIFQPLH